MTASSKLTSNPLSTTSFPLALYDESWGAQPRRLKGKSVSYDQGSCEGPSQCRHLCNTLFPCLESGCPLALTLTAMGNSVVVDVIDCMGRNSKNVTQT